MKSNSISITNVSLSFDAATKLISTLIRHTEISYIIDDNQQPNKVYVNFITMKLSDAIQYFNFSQVFHTHCWIFRYRFQNRIDGVKILLPKLIFYTFRNMQEEI